jgi:lipoate-protein ligase A
MKKDNVKLSRRKTGGGAVYHDLGNTCFSFLTPYDKEQKLDYRTINNQIILDALSKLQVKAEVSGRNDMVVDGKKFSGSAYRLFLGGKDGDGKKSLHHGTIMFSVNFNALQKYLNPNKKKLESKGIDSVISRVANLTEIHPTLSHSSFCREL